MKARETVKQIGVGVCMMLFAVSASAGEWYVDDVSGNDTTGAGTPELPFKTIQKAVVSAAADDTVYVHPGTYDEGTTPGLSWAYGGKSGKQATRVVVTKRLDFVGVGGRDQVTILGDYGDPELALAYRTNSVACVLIEEDAYGTTFTGFTFKDGNSHQSAGDKSLASGGICTRKTLEGSFIVRDCRFDHCFGRGGGAMTDGVAIRTIFTQNRTCYLGSAIYHSKAFNCLFYLNAPSGGTSNRQDLYDSVAVNCLVFGNQDSGAFKSSGTQEGYARYYNTVAYDNYAATADATGQGFNCVLQGNLGTDSQNVTSLGYSVYTNLCVCPYVGDFRPVKDGLLDGTGNSQYLALDFIPAAERTKDFHGNPWTGATTPIGLLLSPAEVKTGVIKIKSSALAINGKDLAKVPAYYQSTEDWPCQVEIGPSSTAPDNLLGITWDSTGMNLDNRGYNFGRREKLLQLMPPKFAFDGKLMVVPTFDARTYSKVLYVDDDAEFSGAADGSSEKPYRQLRDVVAELPDSQYVLVHVAKGHYAAGDDEDPNGAKARLVITGKKCVVFVADDGPEETFIEGAADSTKADGCGENALRCCYLKTTDCTMSGFTFVKGHTWGNDGGKTTANYLGGAVAADVNATFDGCVFTGNRGTTAVGWGGRYFNCTVTNNSHYTRGLFHDQTCFLSGCLIAKNATADWGLTYSVFYNYLFAFNCSVCEPDSAPYNTYNINCRLANCALLTGGHLAEAPAANSGTIYGCVGDTVSKSGSVTIDPERNLRTNPLFASVSTGNYRLLGTSQAVGYSTIAADSHNQIKLDHYLVYLRTDLMGEKLVRADGRLNAGCYVQVQPKLAGVVVSPDGDDGNDGLSEAKPLKTLQVAVEKALTYGELTGQTVIALPGSYTNGATCHSGKVYAGTPSVRSRVVIPAGVTLVSRDGAATTSIVGAEAETSDPTRDQYGRGETAIRCVFLERGAVVRGFTLTNGYTGVVGGYVDDNLGAGAFGRATAECSVEDCLVTGNWSANGAAGSHVSLRRCEITQNHATSYGAVLRTGSVYDSYVHDNYGQGYLCDLFSDIVNCTFVDNYKLDGSDRATLCGNGQNGLVANTVAVGVGGRNSPLGTTAFSNCLFQSDINLEFTDKNVTNSLNFAYTSDELAAMLDNGVPRAADLPMVDAGTDVGTSGGTDVAGTARVKNGTIDIGAFEYDWKDDYAKVLARKGLRVTEVSMTGIVETDGILLLTDGGALQAAFAGKEGHEYNQNVTLVGEGVFILKQNGVEVARLTSSGTLAFRATGSDVLEYAYAGNGSASPASLKDKIGLCLIVR